MKTEKVSFKFAWERAIGTTRYVASVKQVARVLSGYAHLDGSGSRPGVERIMAECSLKRSAVLAAIRILIEDGWITKAPRAGVKRDFFDTYRLLMPAWLAGPESGRPDVRREGEREVVAERMREARRAKAAAADQVRMYGPNQIQTYGPDTEINWGHHTEVSGPYADPDQVHTSGRPGPYTAEEAADQEASRITNRTTLKNNHGAPIVAGASRAPSAAEPQMPDGVDLASARSGENDDTAAAGTERAKAPRKPRRIEPFREETDEYTAAAKKLGWDVIAETLKNWRKARADEYAWARKTALGSMGCKGEHNLKTARGFERADRITLDKALRMHLEDGAWDKTLLAPFTPPAPLAPSKIHDAGDTRRRSDLETYFLAIRLMTGDEVAQFASRLSRECPDHVATAIQYAEADLAHRPELSGEIDRLVCMQFFNTTQGWPSSLTDPLRDRVIVGNWGTS